ncbi:MAG TPA: universal stress protein, partial [Candidatus Lustribacter sp.]|nr:universal stress protein [Candidatus Lustribacter sp.]
MTIDQPQAVQDDGARAPVVAGVDGTGNDELVLAWAAAEAQRLGVALLAVHALDLPSGVVAGGFSDRHEILATVRLERRGEAVRHALERVRTTHPDVETSMVDRWGTPAQELVALGGRASAIVVGGGRKSGLAKLAVGSTSLAVAMHAPCPVVLVRAHT